MFISQSETSKSKISKFVILHAVTLQGSEIFELFKNLKKIEIFWNFWNVQKCFAVIIDKPCDHQIFVCFALSLTVWVLNFKFKFKNWIFLKWPPFGQFWPDICQKLISTSFQYTGCSYKIISFSRSACTVTTIFF